jgi:hypothetical protein
MVAIELRNTFVRGPIVDSANAMGIVFRNEHISNDSLKHLHRCSTSEVYVVSELRDTLWHVVRRLRVLVGGLKLRVAFAQTELGHGKISKPSCWAHFKISMY